MKDIDDILDIILLLVVLGAMLPTLFRSTVNIQSMDTWGFSEQSDKTAQILSGDTIVHGTGEEAMSAAEVLAMLLNSEYMRINYGKIYLPNGVTIDTSDTKYDEWIKHTIQDLINSGKLVSSKTYRISFDRGSKIWRIT